LKFLCHHGIYISLSVKLRSYDALGIMAEALKVEGAGDDRARFRDALAAIKDYQGVTGKFSFDENGNPKKSNDKRARIQGIKSAANSLKIHITMVTEKTLRKSRLFRSSPRSEPKNIIRKGARKAAIHPGMLPLPGRATG
jgi:hypothetical protein